MPVHLSVDIDVSMVRAGAPMVQYDTTQMLRILAFTACGAGALCGLFYSSTRLANGLAGEWIIVETWSEKQYLARLNIREQVRVTIDETGYLKAGLLGLDGMIGMGWCGWDCGSFAANGFDQSYRVTFGGTSKHKLILTNQSPAAVIVAERLAEPAVQD